MKFTQRALFFLLEIAFYLAIIEKVFTAEEKIIEQPKAFHGSIRRIDLPPKSLVNPNFRYGLIQLFEKLSYLTRFIVIELFFEGHVVYLVNWFGEFILTFLF